MVKLRKVLLDEGSGSSWRRILTAAGDCHAISGYASRKGYRRKRLIRVKVLRMLTPRRAGPVGPEELGDGSDDKGASNATSGSVTPGGSYEHGDNSKEFLSTGRTGRRNALPDILGRHAETGLSDLSDRFEELSTHTGYWHIQDVHQRRTGGFSPNGYKIEKNDTFPKSTPRIKKKYF
ncbi:uncharacterized protein [Linepithema humile]|uniref:uncharacterized protein isoform X2 n=1 Tax=Linepithema humile TaxID=83485 RepID=UPI0006236225|nr:PREDICTED: uncharacterized protein LOC105669371 isoform X2 [Linepithema humile]